MRIQSFWFNLLRSVFPSFILFPSLFSYFFYFLDDVIFFCLQKFLILLLRIHECLNSNIRKRWKQNYILFSTTTTITRTFFFRAGINIHVLWWKQPLRRNQKIYTASFAQSQSKIYNVKVGQSLCVFIINFWRTAFHDHFIIFQHFGAELTINFSEEKGCCVVISKAIQIHFLSHTAKYTVSICTLL